MPTAAQPRLMRGEAIKPDFSHSGRRESGDPESR
jgi:hypothetical protein